jgi:hypothetical protein
MSRHPLMIALPLLAVVSAHGWAAEIRVPGDYPTLQAAIDAASPGDVITVATSTTQDPVVITKPLTILGDPALNVRSGCDGYDSEPFHAFRLAGPGSGRVVIGNATLASTADCAHPASSIGGGGFAELHVFNATFKPNPGLSGTADGCSTVKVDVPYILIEGSEIAGGESDGDDCYGYLHGGVWSAIEAPASTVTVLDSKISGPGEPLFYCCKSCTCPATLPSGGEGGHGIVANEVFVDAASEVKGGVGATYYAKVLSSDPGTPCGKKPDGQAFVAAAVHVLPGTIDGSGATPLGGTLALTFDVPGPLALLFVSVGVTAPVLLPGAGYSYLFSPLLVGPVPTGGPQSVSLAVPPLAALLGLEGGFQIFDLSLGLTAPAVAVLGP